MVVFDILIDVLIFLFGTLFGAFSLAGLLLKYGLKKKE